MDACAREDVSQVSLAIMQWEEKWKAMMSEVGKRCEDPRLVENVSAVGHLPEGRERANDDDEAGRERRELRELVSEGGVIHDQQDRANTRRTERGVCTDGRRPCQWQRARRGRLERCGRGSNRVDVLPLRDDGTLRKRL